MQTKLLRSLQLATLLTLSLFALGYTRVSLADEKEDGVPKSLNVAQVELDGKKVDVLVNPKKMTTYIFDKDEKNKSNCYDTCAKNWPPVYLVDEKKGDLKKPFDAIERKDSKELQITYNGKPLYLYKEDAKAGDVEGENVGKVWHATRYKK